MPYYRATGRYRGVVRDGGSEVPFDFADGDIVLVELAQVAALVRDGAPIDYSTPLTADEVSQATARKDAEADADAELREAKRRAIRDHLLAWGSLRCPGNMIAWTDGPAYGAAPHEVLPALTADDHDLGLHAAKHPTGDWVVVACKPHLSAWLNHTAPPPAAPHIDRVTRQYRVLRRWAAEVAIPAAEGMGWRRDHLRLAVDEEVALAGVVAEWIERDAGGGTLVLLDGGKSTQGSAAESVAEPTSGEG